MIYLRPGWLVAYALGALEWLALYRLLGLSAVAVVATFGALVGVAIGVAMHRYPGGGT